jgi:hypothetical protein
VCGFFAYGDSATYEKLFFDFENKMQEKLEIFPELPETFPELSPLLNMRIAFTLST